VIHKIEHNPRPLCFTFLWNILALFASVRGKGQKWLHIIKEKANFNLFPFFVSSTLNWLTPLYVRSIIGSHYLRYVCHQVLCHIRFPHLWCVLYILCTLYVGFKLIITIMIIIIIMNNNNNSSFSSIFSTTFCSESSHPGGKLYTNEQ
jgi:hypothetical protein